MSEENSSGQVSRRRRVRILKKLIVLATAAFMLMPVFFCVILFWKVRVLEKQVGRVSGRLEEVAGLLEETLRGEAAQSLADPDSRTVDEEYFSGEAGERRKGSPENTKSETFAESGGKTISAENTGQATSAENTGQDTGQATSAEGAGQDTGRTVSGEEAQETLRKVYLTFDDGPSGYTMDILDILDRYEVKATFFVLGKEDEQSKASIQEIVNRGHTLGMHSYSHIYADIYRSVEDFAQDFQKLQAYLYWLTGVKSTCYRFPGGSSNTVSRVDMMEFAGFLETQGVEYYDWNISSGDAMSSRLDTYTIVENCTKNIEIYDTAVILMHDSVVKRTTVEALPIIIEKILAMEDTVILPITQDTEPVRHIQKKDSGRMEG
ncbi:MAG: polysaccharide deacetylase [Clostridium sp.]|jgi:peptidoglycan/xylan/chitin deacetylase (PgdA/CDA1 family)|nr:polysaccharide deacetylase [Clostridium sp.]